MRKRVFPFTKIFLCSKKFIHARKGVVGIAAALLMVPPALMTLGSLHYGRELTNLTRVQQASDAAALQYIQRVSHTGASDDKSLRALVDENTRVLSRSALVQSVESTYAADGQRGYAQVKVAYSTLSPVTFQPGNPHPSLLGSRQVRSSGAEIFFRPLELVISLDASASQSSNNVKEMVRKAMEKSFGDDLDNQDIRISLVAYSDNVNLGTEYADALIKEDSRKLTESGSPMAGGGYVVIPTVKSQAVYEAQAATLDAIDPVLKYDLLAESGPGQDWKFAPVARKELKGDDDVEAFVDSLDYPPQSEEEKFDLLVSDGRLLPQPGSNTYAPYAPTPPVSPWTAYLSTFNAVPGGQMKDADVRQIAAIPDPWYEIGSHESEARSLSKYSRWSLGGVITSEPGSPYSGMKYRDAMVSIFPGAPKMRILAGSSSVDEILDRMEDYGAVFMTGIDEAFTWSYRLSSPNWSDVWDKDASFPAPYFSRTKKVMLMYLGSPTLGYSAGTAASRLSIVPSVCRRFAENGVTVKILMPSDDPAHDDERQELADCAAFGSAIGSEYFELSKEQIQETFAELAVRPGKFRNVEPM